MIQIFIADFTKTKGKDLTDPIQNRQSDFYVSVPKSHFMGEIFVVIDDQQRCHPVSVGQLDKKIDSISKETSLGEKLRKKNAQINKSARDLEGPDHQNDNDTSLKKENFKKWPPLKDKLITRSCRTRITFHRPQRTRKKLEEFLPKLRDVMVLRLGFEFRDG